MQEAQPEKTKALVNTCTLTMKQMRMCSGFEQLAKPLFCFGLVVVLVFGDKIPLCVALAVLGLTL